MLKRRSLLLRPADLPRLPAGSRRLCHPASPTPVALRRRGSGYRVSESLPESIPFNQQVHQVLSDARPQTPGIYRGDANPSTSSFAAGASLTLIPSLVLAPESALSLLPSRGLSSAPAARSVSATVVVGNGGTKKGLDSRSAFRHGC